MNDSSEKYKAAILIASDRSFNKVRDDEAGPALEKRLTELGFIVVRREILPDDEERIVGLLIDWSNGSGINLIVTSGGTGLGPRDVTPDATLKVIEKRVPGIEEAMRAESLNHTPNGMLSRSVVGVVGECLVVNLPGSPVGALENLDVIAPALSHALDLITGKTPDK